ncbi:hypothetical protein BBJ28_00002467 [Nothophytophthora sp. Chile5]|nr:hypothetical protein BBJ28_00002467 [Nothophytophthora sp. Chile5]
MKAKAAEREGDGSFMRIEVISMLKLLVVSGIGVTFLALFVLIGFSGSPGVSQSDWTSIPTRCTSDFSLALFEECVGSNETSAATNTETNGSIAAIDEVLNLPLSKQVAVLTCMFDACTNRTNRPFASDEQELHVIHYSFGLNGFKQRNRYFYLEASFPNPTKTAQSFDVTITPHAKGFYLNETSGNQTSAEIITDVRQRTVTIECEQGEAYCTQEYFLRFGDIDFSDYQIDVLFNSTESLALNGSNVQFRKTWGTEAFTNWLIGMKLFFMFLSVFVAAWYIFCINKLSSREQNIEQGWVIALAVALVFFNDPFYFAEAAFGSNPVRILSVGFQVTFFQLLLLFWLIAIDNLRLQGKESGVSNSQFFAPKIIFTAFFWFIMVLYYGYQKYNSNNDVTWDPLEANGTFALVKVLCTMLSIIYILWFGLLVLMSTAEILARRMRYRYLVGLNLLMVIASFAGLGGGVFSPAPPSGGAWTSLQALFNVYVFTLCYLHAPSATTLATLKKRNQVHGGNDPETKSVLANNSAEVDLADVEVRDTDLA